MTTDYIDVGLYLDKTAWEGGTINYQALKRSYGDKLNNLQLLDTIRLPVERPEPTSLKTQAAQQLEDRAAVMRAQVEADILTMQAALERKLADAAPTFVRLDLVDAPQGALQIGSVEEQAILTAAAVSVGELPVSKTPPTPVPVGIVTPG